MTTDPAVQPLSGADVVWRLHVVKCDVMVKRGIEVEIGAVGCTPSASLNVFALSFRTPNI